MDAPITLMAIGFPGPGELMIIFLIILLLFGGAKLPEMARNIGRGMRIFKEEANALRREIEIEDKTPANPAQAGAKSPTTTVEAVKVKEAVKEEPKTQAQAQPQDQTQTQPTPTPETKSAGS